MKTKTQIRKAIKKFAQDLAPFVEKHGKALCAETCGVSIRSIELWLHGESNVNACTMTGAIFLLQDLDNKPKGN